MGKIEKWINPIYVSEYSEGTLSLRRRESPFVHAVLPNFFSSEAACAILQHAGQVPVEMSHRQGLAKKADWYWGAFSHLEFIRFFLGPEMRAFLNELIGSKLVVKPRAIPQFNIFRPGSSGIPIHTDFCEKVGIVSLIQLSHGWKPGLGGELILYRREGSRIVPDQVVTPECNKLILFNVGRESYHSVEDMTGEWTRRTITYDWLTESLIHASSTVPEGA